MPGGRNNIKPEDGKQFSSEYQPENRGRKPLIFTEIFQAFKEEGYEEATQEHIIRTYQQMLALPLSKIIEIAGSPKDDNGFPSVMRLMARSLLDTKKSSEVIEKMLNRAHGTPRSSVDMNFGGAISIDSNIGMPDAKAIKQALEALRNNT